MFAIQIGSDPTLVVILADVRSDATVGITSIEQSIEDLCMTRDGKRLMCPVLLRKAAVVQGSEPRVDAVFELVKVQLLRTRSYPIPQFR